MNPFNEMLRKYTIKYNDRIRKFCEPLQLAYGINYFSYYTITHTGLFGTFGSRADWVEHCFSQQMPLKNDPYARHPDNYQSGVIFWGNDEMIHDEFQRVQYLASRKFDMKYCLFLNKKTNDRFESFGFGVSPAVLNAPALLANEISFLQLFITRFYEEFNRMMTDFSHDLVDIVTPMGPLFYEKIELFPPHLVKKRQYLLKQLEIEFPHSLSKRELQIIPFYLKGYSASRIAKELFLGRRTIEHYIESLKHKLGCFSKYELIEKLTILQHSLNSSSLF